MARGMKTLTSGKASWSTLALIAFMTLPRAIDAQQTQVVADAQTGWFGVRISDQAMLDERGNAFFDGYPVVKSVDPGSPAAKAGVLAGDVLLTFNSHDMRGASAGLSKWLKVGAPFMLRIRRNDAIRVIRGRLEKRPENWEENMVLELTVPQIMEQRTGSIAHAPIRNVKILRGMPAPEPLSVLTPALGYGGGVYPFAGAEFTALCDDLAEVLGVKPEGVVVTNVVEGSAARTAGLRGGDVVVKADSIKIVNPIDLVRAIRIADENDRSVDLQIVRKRKSQSLVLRW